MLLLPRLKDSHLVRWYKDDQISDFGPRLHDTPPRPAFRPLIRITCKRNDQNPRAPRHLFREEAAHMATKCGDRSMALKIPATSRK